MKGLGNESLYCRCGVQRDAGGVTRVCAGPGRRPGSGQARAGRPAPAAPAAARRPRRQPPAPKPFPQGAKVAYVVLQRIANESADGRVATTRIQALQQKKAAELNEKNKQLTAMQQKLEKEGAVMSAAVARRTAEEHREG